MDPIRRRLVRLTPGAGWTAVSVEPLGAVARRGLVGRAGYEPLRETDANTRGTEGPRRRCWVGSESLRSCPCSRTPDSPRALIPHAWLAELAVVDQPRP